MHEQEMPLHSVDDRTPDELEAAAVKWNVARIVRLTSGAFALLTHYNEGALNLIKVGTLAELADYIPTAADCETEYVPRVAKGKLTTLDLADLGL